VTAAAAAAASGAVLWTDSLAYLECKKEKREEEEKEQVWPEMKRRKDKEICSLASLLLFTVDSG